jgi:membrane protease YdiL (CAAX protease family)
MTPVVHEVVDSRPTRVAIVALLLGAVLLGVTLNVRDGSWQFYTAGFAMAAIWIGAFVAAGTTLRRDRRTVLDATIGVVVGGAMFGVFAAGSWALHRLDLFANAIDELLRTADSSKLVWVLALAWVNAVAEELFFRGTLIQAARGRYPLLVGVVPYVLTTVPSGNPALVLAAAIMGTVFALLRIWTGTLTASIATHLTWSTLMILAFPR